MNHRLAKLLLLSVSLGFTVFVFMNTYEVVFNKDIPIADSVQKMAAQAPIAAIVKQFDILPDQSQGERNAEYAHLQYIQLPAIKSTLNLEEKRVIDGQWYARPNLGHYVGLDKDDHNITIDYLIYAISSWRTLPSPNQIDIGMDVDVFHDNGQQANYKVAEKKVLPLGTNFVASKSDTRQIVLLVEDPGAGTYYGFSLVQKG